MVLLVHSAHSQAPPNHSRIGLTDRHVGSNVGVLVRAVEGDGEPRDVDCFVTPAGRKRTKYVASNSARRFRRSQHPAPAALTSGIQ